MTPDDPNPGLGRLVPTLVEISHTLEATDDAGARIRRVLALAGNCIPYRRCALLERAPGRIENLYVVPEPPAGEREPLRSSMARLLRVMDEAEEAAQPPSELPQLALPLVGLDRIIGVIRVELAPEVPQRVAHLQVLSLIAAQLASYLTVLRLREEEADRARELRLAHDFQQLMAGVVGHDLRNPLSVIMTIAAAQLQKPRDARQAAALEKIVTSVRLADRIIGDLTDATRARTAGGLSISPQPVELVHLLEEVIADARLAHPGREIALVAPDGDVVRGTWDPQRLAQAVTNLLNNALLHGDPQGPVEVRLSGAARTAEIAVHNQGEPIPESLRPVIFDPFRRGGSSAAGKGLGLGLYIVAQILRAHGGDVEVTSSRGEGTTFTLRLPRDPADANRGEAGSAPPSP